MPSSIALPPACAPSADDDARYLALKARDARFDGRFFTGVTSTGIYCRPVCAVRTPRRENCRFFQCAAQAEHAGFRPCLRCRPELAPQALAWSTQDASGILLRQALRMLEAPDTWSQPDSPALVAQLAARVGVSDRHLRRLFDAALGVSPLQYLQTRRLLCAKQLLTDTALSVTQVALVSGFGSVRRFNAAFVGHYGLNPTQLRRSGAQVNTGGATVRLGYRPPYAVAALLQFLATRQIHGVEDIVQTDALQAVRRTVRLAQGDAVYTGWLEARFDPTRPQVLLHTSDSLLPVLPQVIGRVRALLDLDADPEDIDTLLNPQLGERFAGYRVPGAFDGFEMAVRAILGQQITVAAARTLAQRLRDTLGEAIETPWPTLSHHFPSPAVLAQVDGDTLGRLGIVRQRQAAIVALARAVQDGHIALHASADVDSTMAALRALPGIGDWTAQYIAMRALRWPDAFPAADVALHKAMGVQGAPKAAQAALAQAEAWRPWRAYGVIRAWAQL